MRVCFIRILIYHDIFPTAVVETSTNGVHDPTASTPPPDSHHTPPPLPHPTAPHPRTPTLAPRPNTPHPFRLPHHARPTTPSRGRRQRRKPLNPPPPASGRAGTACWDHSPVLANLRNLQTPKPHRANPLPPTPPSKIVQGSS